MEAFFVGLLVILAVFALAGMGILLFPFLLVLGILFRILIIFVLALLSIWLIGKVVLLFIEALTRKEKK